MNVTIRKKSVIPLIALLFFAAYSSCDKKKNIDGANAVAGAKTVETNESERPEVEPPTFDMKTEILPVRAIEVYSSGGKNTRWYNGIARSHQYNEFSFKIGGVISEINQREGSKIIYERVLARLDSTECEKKVRRLRTQLRRAQIDAYKAKARLQKLMGLNKQNAAPEEDVNAAAKAVKTAEDKVREKNKELQESLVELGHHVLRFTSRGTLKSLKAKVGDHVKAGQTIAVFDLNMPRGITVEIPAIYLCQIGLDSKGKVKFEGLKGIYPVDIIKIGKLTAKPDAKIPITVSLRNPYSYLKPGTKTRVALKFDYRSRRKRRYILPPGSVGEDDEGMFVYIVKPGEGDMGIVERRSVVTGETNAQGHEVLEGLEDGEIIAVRPVHRLKDGIEVKYK